jgi:hypothetical protein
MPTIVRKVAVNKSKDLIGRRISLENFKLNYFTGTATLIDFKLYEKDDSSIFASFDTLLIDTEPYRLLKNNIVVEQLFLEGLHVNVVMYDSAFNFDDLLLLASGDTTAEEKSDEPLKFEFSNLELKKAFITAKDASIGKQMELTNFDFFIPYIGWNQEDKSQAGLKFDFKNGGYFQSQIEINPNQGDFEAIVKLQQLDISGYHDFVSKYINISPFFGKTNIELDLVGNIHKPEETLASVSLQVNDFEWHDFDGKRVAAAKRLNVNVSQADQANDRIIIDTVALQEPYLFVQLYDSSNNIVELINQVIPTSDSLEMGSEVSVEADTSSSTLYYALNSFLIKNGVVDILDTRTGDPFKYHLSRMNVNADSITSESRWVQTSANMLLNERGKLVAQLGIDLTNPMNLSVDYTISDFMLSDLNIYSRYYMGFPILYGDMYYKAHTEIRDGELVSENKIIIHNVEIGNKSGGLHDLPMKFALFLLKDKDGVITLDVPVEGDLKDPKVSVGKIVWNTFKNLIVKAASAPVKLLSGLLGVDPRQIESIDYSFKDTTFTEKKRQQLDLLLELEQQKPELEIELIYFNDPQLEGNEIALAEAGRIFNEKKNQDYKQNQEEHLKFIRKQVKADTIGLLAGSRQLVGQNTIDSIFNNYEYHRLESVESYLKQVNDSTEILVIRSKENAPKNAGSMPRFEVKYGMKEEVMQ